MRVSGIDKGWVAAGGAALLAIIVWGAGVRAFNPQPDPPGFGLIGIGYGQTIRLNVVNTGGVLSVLPPDPCKVQLGFLDGEGHYMRKAGGRDGAAADPVRKAGRLDAGQSMSLDLSSDEVMLDSSGRLEVRAAWINDGVGKLPPGPCRASLEMIDNSTGRTSFAVPGAALEQDFHFR